MGIIINARVIISPILCKKVHILIVLSCDHKAGLVPAFYFYPGQIIFCMRWLLPVTKGFRLL